MGLTEIRLGELIEPVNGRNKIGDLDISGVDINKQFISTRANLEGTDISNYKNVPPKCFAANFMHIGRDIKLPVAYNSSDKIKVVSPAYSVFRVKSDKILENYLYILMTSNEFDRLTWFYTDSSVRGNLDWSSFCSIPLKLPSPEIQQKVVDAYKAISDNLEAYTGGLENLKTTCQAYIEKLAKEYPLEAIGEYIEPCHDKNSNEIYGLEDVKGISTGKVFIETKANMEDVSLKSYLLVSPQQFAFVPDTSRRGDKIALALNNSNRTYLISAIYQVFNVKDSDLLIPEYLYLWISRPEFDRYTRYHFWGSAREVFSYNDMCRVSIPIPPKAIQQSIVDIYHAQFERQEIADKLSKTLREICPVLIKQSLSQ